MKKSKEKMPKHPDGEAVVKELVVALKEGVPETKEIEHLSIDKQTNDKIAFSFDFVDLKSKEKSKFSGRLALKTNRSKVSLKSSRRSDSTYYKQLRKALEGHLEAIRQATHISSTESKATRRGSPLSRAAASTKIVSVIVPEPSNSETKNQPQNSQGQNEQDKAIDIKSAVPSGSFPPALIEAAAEHARSVQKESAEEAPMSTDTQAEEGGNPWRPLKLLGWLVASGFILLLAFLSYKYLTSPSIGTYGYLDGAVKVQVAEQLKDFQDKTDAQLGTISHTLVGVVHDQAKTKQDQQKMEAQLTSFEQHVDESFASLSDCLNNKAPATSVLVEGPQLNQEGEKGLNKTQLQQVDCLVERSMEKHDKQFTEVANKLIAELKEKTSAAPAPAAPAYRPQQTDIQVPRYSPNIVMQDVAIDYYPNYYYPQEYCYQRSGRWFSAPVVIFSGGGGGRGGGGRGRH